jgi:transposase
VALSNGINANQLRRWMRERGIEPPELSCLALRPVTSEAVGGFVPVQLPPSLDAPIRLELRKGAAALTVEWPASSAAACGAWLREWLG